MEKYGFDSAAVEQLLGELEKDGAGYAATESTSPIGKPGDHYLNQLSARGYAEVPKDEDGPKKSAENSNDKVMRAYTAVNISSVRSIDSVNGTFVAKLRLYMLWQYDVCSLGPQFKHLSEKAKANGHYYSLNESESNELIKVMPCPMDQSIFYNATSVVDQDDFMGIRVYTFGVMVNRMYDVTFTDHYDLEKFPFDSQSLTIDLGLNNQYKNLFDLSVHAVMFNRKALAMHEWTVDPPTVERHRVKARNTKVLLHITRKSMYYVTNIIVIMLGLVALCFSAFAVPVDDLADRMSIILTLLLTAVAFKFVIADSLPKLGFNTFLDTFILLNFGTLVYMGGICSVSAAVPFDNMIGLGSSLGIFAFSNIVWLIAVLRELHLHAKERRKSGISTDAVAKLLSDEPKRNWPVKTQHPT